eukprot:6023790-Prymnesium_polylepis.1
MFYIYVRDETRRGQHLDKYPLTMIGVDFNSDALAETGINLSAAAVPHDLLHGDIGDPVPMQQGLLAKFGVTCDQVGLQCLNMRPIPIACPHVQLNGTLPPTLHHH